ncbi:hypothetical protein B0T19DRAFT_57954 [Cercophora scortea]|uniref:Uncharacterized protein n=1 Tax=Cercophora scortea TaxID=314031 RepID=A0AAE0J5M8_9PEZI|nr:hypothetical protein B0T19DRAFT_57954 [Cercophora scortea]
MKFIITTTAVLGLVGLVAAQSDLVCPTVTKTRQPRSCQKTCDYNDCAFVTTVKNPCGCPASLPTATLIAPCAADCPYGGCDVEFRTLELPCPTPTSSTRTRRPWPTSTSTTSTTSTSTTTTTTSPTKISIGITTLTPIKTTTPCPTIVKTTSPADCPAIRCPVPTCIARESLLIPCKCTPRTLLHVQGCATACPTGCFTRSETITAENC